jgi:hypothetical protein
MKGETITKNSGGWQDLEDGVTPALSRLGILGPVSRTALSLGSV